MIDIDRLANTAIWSFLLFVATFRNFDFFPIDEPGFDSIGNYLFPMVMVLALFLFDAIGSSVELGNAFPPMKLVAVIVFLIAMVYSMMSSNIIVQVLLFVVAWVALAFLKYGIVIAAKKIKSN